MSFFKKMFERTPPDQATEAQLNEIFVPFRDAICDFKDATKISWLAIAPQIFDFSALMFVQTRGAIATKTFLKDRFHRIDQMPGAPLSSIIDMTLPEPPADDQAAAIKIVGELVHKMLAKPYPADHVAQVLFEAGEFIAVHAGEKYLAAKLLHRTYEKLEAGDFA